MTDKITPDTYFMQHGIDSLARKVENSRNKSKEAKEDWSSRFLFKGGGVSLEGGVRSAWQEERDRQAFLPEGKDEHEKYYVRK